MKYKFTGLGAIILLALIVCLIAACGQKEDQAKLEWASAIAEQELEAFCEREGLDAADYKTMIMKDTDPDYRDDTHRFLMVKEILPKRSVLIRVDGDGKVELRELPFRN